MTELASLTPWLRRLAKRYSDVDDIDAFVSEGMLVALRKLPGWNPERAPIEVYLYPWVRAAYRDHANAVMGKLDRISIHGMSCTELIAEWRIEATADQDFERAREIRRDRDRLRKAVDTLTPRQQVVVKMRLKSDDQTMADTAEELGVTKQAVSVHHQRAMARLAERRWLDSRGDRKTRRLQLTLRKHELDEAKATGYRLTVFAAAAAEHPFALGGTEAVDLCAAGTWVAPGIAKKLQDNAKAIGVSVSHLVRAQMRKALGNSS